MTAVALAGHAAAEAGAQTRLTALAAELDRSKQNRAGLEHSLREHQQATARAAAERDKLRAALATLEQQRDQLSLQLGEQKAAVAAATAAGRHAAELRSHLDSALAEIKTFEARHAELTAELASNATAAARALKAVEKAGAEVAAAGAELVALRKQAAGNDRDQYARHALQVIKLVATDLNSDDLPLERIRLLVHKAGRLLKAATVTEGPEPMAALAAAQKRLESSMGKRETAVEHQTNITITGRSLEIDLAHQTDVLARARQALAGLEKELESAANDAAQLGQATGHGGIHGAAPWPKTRTNWRHSASTSAGFDSSGQRLRAGRFIGKIGAHVGSHPGNPSRNGGAQTAASRRPR